MTLCLHAWMHHIKILRLRANNACMDAIDRMSASTSQVRGQSCLSSSGPAGGVADSVAKWVFRQDLAPERLKEILLLHKRRSGAEADGGEMEEHRGGGKEGHGEEKEKEKEEEVSPEDSDRTAGNGFSAARQMASQRGGRTHTWSDRKSRLSSRTRH